MFIWQEHVSTCAIYILVYFSVVATKIISTPIDRSHMTSRRPYCWCKIMKNRPYRTFLRDVMSAILVYLNNEKSAILVYQISPVGVELFCNGTTFFCFIKQIWPLVTWVKTLYWWCKPVLWEMNSLLRNWGAVADETVTFVSNYETRKRSFLYLEKIRLEATKISVFFIKELLL